MNEQGNVLVIGNSGVGKSTLINAVLGDDVALTGVGTEGTTKRLEVYEDPDVPFRIIDTVGFEPSFRKRRQAIRAVRKWSKDGLKAENENRDINVIWFCVDGGVGKLFDQTIDSFTKATSMWKTVPIIVVITKSFAEPDRPINIELVKEAFENQKKKPEEIIPVVASTYTINESAFAPPFGITELIDITNDLMPVGKQAAKKDISRFKLNRKRVLAHSLFSVATLSAITVGASPIFKVDAMILGGIEVTLINGLAKIYEIDNDELNLFNISIKGVGALSLVAKRLVSQLKIIPGIKLGAAVIQAIVAGTIVATLGQGSIYIFEKFYTGENSFEDIEWINKVMDEQFSNKFIDKVISIAKQVSENMKDENIDIMQMVSSLIMEFFNNDTMSSKEE